MGIRPNPKVPPISLSPGGGGGVTTENSGVVVDSPATTINFGDGLLATGGAGTTTVDASVNLQTAYDTAPDADVLMTGTVGNSEWTIDGGDPLAANESMIVLDSTGGASNAALELLAPTSIPELLFSAADALVKGADGADDTDGTGITIEAGQGGLSVAAPGGDGGTINITGLPGGASSAGNPAGDGSPINITAGDGGPDTGGGGEGAGAPITITTGTGLGGGDFNVTTGDAGATNSRAGAVTFTIGDSTGFEQGPDFSIFGGGGGFGGGRGSDIHIEAGEARGGGDVGGHVILMPREGNAGGDDGDVSVITGAFMSNPARLRWWDGDERVSNYVGISAPSGVTSYDMIWPTAQGAAGSLLENDGSGNLAWTNIITEAQTITFGAAPVSVASSATPTVDLTAGQKQELTLSANIGAGGITITAPPGTGNFILEIRQPGGSAFTLDPGAWPVNVRWVGGTAPTAPASGETKLISFYYNGTDYLGQFTGDIP